MANQPEQKSGDPRQQNPTSTGRGESKTVGPPNSQANRSTSSGRSSDESDCRPYEGSGTQSGKSLTMGSNGGGADSEVEGEGREQSINSGTMQERKAS